MNIKKFYRPIANYKIENGNYITISRCVIDKEIIDEWKRENEKTKVVFLNEEYSDLSFDESVNEIHKFKSKYPGNSYFRFPLKVIKGLDDKYISGIYMLESDYTSDGYILISKLDLRNWDNSMKKANKKEREEYAKRICLEKLYEYNNILACNVFNVKEVDKCGNIVNEETLIGKETLEKHLFKYLPTFNPNVLDNKYRFVLS